MVPKKDMVIVSGEYFYKMRIFYHLYADHSDFVKKRKRIHGKERG